MKLAYWVDGEVRPEERLSSAISASDRASSSNWKERVIVHVLYLEKRGNSPILPQTIWCLIPATDKEHCTCQVEKKNLLIRPLIHSPTDSLYLTPDILHFSFSWQSFSTIVQFFYNHQCRTSCSLVQAILWLNLTFVLALLVGHTSLW